MVILAPVDSHPFPYKERESLGTVTTVGAGLNLPHPPPLGAQHRPGRGCENSTYSDRSNRA